VPCRESAEGGWRMERAEHRRDECRKDPAACQTGVNDGEAADRVPSSVKRRWP
jgi:hypothetical protein